LRNIALHTQHKFVNRLSVLWAPLSDLHED